MRADAVQYRLFFYLPPKTLNSQGEIGIFESIKQFVTYG